ncbi:MAG TPA: AraC family transcriptional regulator [Microlunatus sp.]|nr:AraC family transcriptional regulator [Microlunatus sp.]
MLDDLIFLHGAGTPECIASVDKRFSYYTLQLLTSGGVELFYDDQRWELTDGVWTWPCYPGPWIRFHEWPRGRPWHHRYLSFTGPRVASWQADGLWPRRPARAGPELARSLTGLLDDAMELAQRPDTWSHRRAANLIERMLLELAEAARAPGPGRPPWLDRVLRELAVVDRPPDYARLAAEVGMSVTTLRRRFREVTGRSPHQHHLQCRVTEAKRRLSDTDEPIKSIAQRLGYRDVFYFSRQFRQLAGTSPASYRQSRQA